jgi:hypothetical protein
MPLKSENPTPAVLFSKVECKTQSTQHATKEHQIARASFFPHQVDHLDVTDE